MVNIKAAINSSPSQLRIWVLVSSIVLTIIAGLFLIIGAAISMLVVSASNKFPIPNNFLLLLAIVLLILILVLLLVLLGCSGCFDRKRRFTSEFMNLIPILPGLIQKLGPTVRATAIALQFNSKAINVISENLENAIDSLEFPVFEIVIPSITFSDIIPNAPVISKIEMITYELGNEVGLSSVTDALEKLRMNLDSLTDAASDLETASQLLDELGIALGQDPIPS